MLITTLEQERKKIYQQGKTAGFLEGEATELAKGEAAGVLKGRLETQHQTLERLLPFCFEVTEAEQHQLVQQLRQLHDLTALDALVNLLLNKTASLADFVALLTQSLPATKPEANEAGG